MASDSTTPDPDRNPDPQRYPNQSSGLAASRDEAFVQLISAEQFGLYRYIATLLGNSNDAHNVLQETNLVMWRKSQDFTPGTNFAAWARRIAYFQSKAYTRDRNRDRLVFSEALLTQIADNVSTDDDDERKLALRHCLTDLSTRNREMLRQRYGENLPIQDIAERLGKAPTAVKVALLRLRRALLKCIQRQLTQGA
jgi:RNA polymerase sigma-70 factor, ECF subfamily